MTKEPARYNESDFPVKSIDEVRNWFTASLMQKICEAGGLEGDPKEIKVRLSNLVYFYHVSAANGPDLASALQPREFQNLHKSVERVLAALDRLTEENLTGIDHEIQYRPPFNSRFYFREQLDYWAANKGSVQKTQNLLKMISWAAERVTIKIKKEHSHGKPTKNSHLNNLILELAVLFEEAAGKRASSQCYYSASDGNYAGQLFDFIVLILDNFAPTSYHSQGALGKRIVRLLKAEFE